MYSKSMSTPTYPFSRMTSRRFVSTVSWSCGSEKSRDALAVEKPPVSSRLEKTSTGAELNLQAAAMSSVSEAGISVPDSVKP